MIDGKTLTFLGQNSRLAAPGPKEGEPWGSSVLSKKSGTPKTFENAKKEQNQSFITVDLALRLFSSYCSCYLLDPYSRFETGFLAPEFEEGNMPGSSGYSQKPVFRTNS